MVVTSGRESVEGTGKEVRKTTGMVAVARAVLNLSDISRISRRYGWRNLFNSGTHPTTDSTMSNPVAVFPGTCDHLHVSLINVEQQITITSSPRLNTSSCVLSRRVGYEKGGSICHLQTSGCMCAVRRMLRDAPPTVLQNVPAQAGVRAERGNTSLRMRQSKPVIGRRRDSMFVAHCSHFVSTVAICVTDITSQPRRTGNEIHRDQE